jgi:hypothetical protein
VVPGGGFRRSFQREAGLSGQDFLIRAMKNSGKIFWKIISGFFFFEIFPENFQREKFLKRFVAGLVRWE